MDLDASLEPGSPRAPAPSSDPLPLTMRHRDDTEESPVVQVVRA